MKKYTLQLILCFLSFNVSAQNWVDGQAGAISTSNIAVFQAVTGGLIDIEGTAAPCNAENDLTLGYVKSSNTIQLCDVSLGGWQVGDEYDGEQAVINAVTVNATSLNGNSISASTGNITTINSSTVNSGSVNLTSEIKATRLTDANNTGYYSDPSWISRYNVLRPSYIELQTMVSANGGCSPTGRMAKDSSGKILSCQSGLWKDAFSSNQVVVGPRRSAVWQTALTCPLDPGMKLPSLSEASILMQHGKIPTGTLVWTSDLVNDGDAWRIENPRNVSGRDVDGVVYYYCFKGSLESL